MTSNDKNIRLDMAEVLEINNHFANDLPANDIFAKATVGEFIAQGGQALVYSLSGMSTTEQYVVKIIYGDSSEDINSRFYKITQASAELVELGYEHTICKVERAFITAENSLHCIIEKKRICLTDYISKSDNVDYAEIAIRLGADLLVMLDSCQQYGIMHRDIKVSNIFLKGTSISDAICLGDFGTTTHIDDKNILTTQNFRGTPSTTAPEFLAIASTVVTTNSVPIDENSIKKFKDISKSDMYSLAATMYYILNDLSYPFSKTENRFINNGKPCPPPKNGSDQLKKIVVKALNFFPVDRYKTCNEMLDDIKQTPEYTTYINPFSDVTSTRKYTNSRITGNKKAKRHKRKSKNNKKFYKKKSFIITAVIAVLLIFFISAINDDKPSANLASTNSTKITFDTDESVASVDGVSIIADSAGVHYFKEDDETGKTVFDYPATSPAFNGKIAYFFETDIEDNSMPSSNGSKKRNKLYSYDVEDGGIKELLTTNGNYGVSIVYVNDSFVYYTDCTDTEASTSNSDIHIALFKYDKSTRSTQKVLETISDKKELIDDKLIYRTTSATKKNEFAEIYCFDFSSDSSVIISDKAYWLDCYNGDVRYILQEKNEANQTVFTVNTYSPDLDYKSRTATLDFLSDETTDITFSAFKYNIYIECDTDYFRYNIVDKTHFDASKEERFDFSNAEKVSYVYVCPEKSGKVFLVNGIDNYSEITKLDEGETLADATTNGLYIRSNDEIRFYKTNIR